MHCQQVPSHSVNWPTDLCDRGHTLWDFFEPKRSALHREAVAATAGGATQRQLRETGQDGHDKSGEPQVVHGDFRSGFQGQHLERGGGRGISQFLHSVVFYH